MLSLGRRLRNEDGNILIAVVLISMLVGMLAALTLSTGQQADWASAKDRNREIALGVAEAGVHDAVTRIEKEIAAGFVTRIPATAGQNITRATDSGSYAYNVTRVGDNFVIDAQGTVAGGARLQRKRHLKITLQPPEMFPGAGYALFSKTNLYLKNNNEVYDGDVWANDSLWAEGGAIIEGSVTSAQSWVRIENGGRVDRYVWAGGRRCDVEGQNPCVAGFGVSLGQNALVKEFVKSSVSAPSCTGENTNAYKVINNGEIRGDVTSYGPVQGNTPTSPSVVIRTCTSAQPRKDPPVFTFNRWNYDQSTYHTFASAAAFNNALNNNLNGIVKSALVGTFVITECNDGVVNVSGSDLAGTVTIVTNPEPCANGTKGARIRTDNVGDGPVPAGTKAKFVLVSHYAPPAGTPCTDHDDDFCAISAKNHFDSTCKTSTLVYADNGPVSMKNDTGPSSNIMCGSIIASGIHMKNDLRLTYDPVFDRTLGFGPQVYEIARWEELPAS